MEAELAVWTLAVTPKAPRNNAKAMMAAKNNRWAFTWVFIIGLLSLRSYFYR
jgi:hypothetical protein